MSTVSPTEWQTRVMTAFKTYWATTVNASVQILSPNRPSDRAKVTGNSFIEWTMLGAPDGQSRYSWSVANNHFSQAGTWTFLANVKVELQSSLALDLLDSVSLFYETAVVQDGYFHGIGTPVPLGSDGAWYQVSLSSNWLYFTDRSSTPVVVV